MIKYNGELDIAISKSKSEHTSKYSPHNNQYIKGRQNDTHKSI